MHASMHPAVEAQSVLDGAPASVGIELRTKPSDSEVRATPHDARGVELCFKAFQERGNRA